MSEVNGGDQRPKQEPSATLRATLAAEAASKGTGEAQADLSDCEAVILAGGLGTRLRSVLADRPKPLAIVAGRPFLAWILDMVAAAGVRRAVICTGYLAHMVEAELGHQHGPLQLRYSREQTPRGTGGALLDALPQTSSETVLALNGDSLCLADLRQFAAEHRRRAAVASLLLTQVDDCSRYGRVNLAADGRVTAFVEKGGEATPGWINAGVYLIRRDALLAWPSGSEPVSLERQIFPAWQNQGQLWGHAQGTAPFIDIGTPETLAAAEGFLRRPHQEQRLHFASQHGLT